MKQKTLYQITRQIIKERLGKLMIKLAAFELRYPVQIT